MGRIEQRSDRLILAIGIVVIIHRLHVSRQVAQVIANELQAMFGAEHRARRFNTYRNIWRLSEDKQSKREQEGGSVCDSNANLCSY
jgi:hypothetical protein